MCVHNHNEDMEEKGRASDHTSFLNNLLLLREQEIRMLSKKLYHQAALDSDGGSGKSPSMLMRNKDFHL